MSYVIAVGHRKGGVGKTTTAINVAVELQRKKDVVVVDLDDQRQFTKFNNKRSKKLTMKDIRSKSELEQFLRSYDGVVIIDLGGYDSELARSAMVLSDLIIVPLSGTDNDIHGLIEFTKIIKKIQEVQKAYMIECCILTNRVHARDKSTQRRFKEFCADHEGFDAFDTIISQNMIHANMLSSGKNAVELTNKDHTAYKQVKSLAKEIISKIEG